MKKLSFSLSTILISWTFCLIAGSTQIGTINVDTDGIALKGYDTVAYFTMGLPVKGLKEFQYNWQGAKWLFSNHEHLTLFQENPEKYAPQYGGY